jgi:hypothetical protein
MDGKPCVSGLEMALAFLYAQAREDEERLGDVGVAHGMPPSRTAI